jgi:hypothetical protein
MFMTNPQNDEALDGVTVLACGCHVLDDVMHVVEQCGQHDDQEAMELP